MSSTRGGLRLRSLGSRACGLRILVFKVLGFEFLESVC